MGIFERAEEHYEDYRQEYGDGDYAWDMAMDAAREDHQRAIQAEQQQTDFADFLQEDAQAAQESQSDNTINFPSGAPLQDTAVAAASGIFALASAPVVIVLGIGLLCGLAGFLHARHEVKAQEAREREE